MQAQGRAALAMRRCSLVPFSHVQSASRASAAAASAIGRSRNVDYYGTATGGPPMARRALPAIIAST
jgi:hypothetical protein